MKKSMFYTCDLFNSYSTCFYDIFLSNWSRGKQTLLVWVRNDRVGDETTGYETTGNPSSKLKTTYVFFRLDRERLPVHLQGSHQALCSSAFLSWKVAKQNVHAWKYRRVFRMKIQWTPHSKEKKAHKRPPKSPGLFSPLKIRNTPWKRKIMKSVTPIQCKRKSAIMVRKCYFPLLWCLAEINERNSSGRMEYSVCQATEHHSSAWSGIEKSELGICCG